MFYTLLNAYIHRRITHMCLHTKQSESVAFHVKQELYIKAFLTDNKLVCPQRPWHLKLKEHSLDNYIYLFNFLEVQKSILMLMSSKRFFGVPHLR